jgi:hypothetical protein
MKATFEIFPWIFVNLLLLYKIIQSQSHTSWLHLWTYHVLSYFNNVYTCVDEVEYKQVQKYAYGCWKGEMGAIDQKWDKIENWAKFGGGMEVVIELVCREGGLDPAGLLTLLTILPSTFPNPFFPLWPPIATP